MDKVKITRELADAIERVWSEHGDLHSKHMTLTNWNYLDGNYHLSVKILRPYAENHPIEYMTALVVGYEVEETPEDKVREYYKEQRMTKGADQDSTDHAIKKVLDWLNIKIEGVNA